eukprot:12411914-Alexandrium_andersonii.AAC.1
MTSATSRAPGVLLVHTRPKQAMPLQIVSDVHSLGPSAFLFVCGQCNVARAGRSLARGVRACVPSTSVRAYVCTRGGRGARLSPS